MTKFLKNGSYLMALLCLLFLSACTNKPDNTDESNEALPTQSETGVQPEDSISDMITENVDLSSSFNGINGCAVLYSPRDNKYSLYNSSICEQEVSPYSTFKIISTLIGLKDGVIENETSTMNYTGTQYPIAEWNGNLTLQEAFQTSCIWYFRQVIDAVGIDEIKSELNNLMYGNCDVSEWNGSNTNSIPELNGFWLDSSLKISPLEQVQILTRIFEGKNGFQEEDISVLKKIMVVNDGTQNIYGKTGSGSNGEAWFVGFSEKNNERKYFAIYLNDIMQKESVSGNIAKEIALKIMK